VNDKSYLDLIFESRNKDYGAFALRNLYNKNLSVALLSSVIGFLTLSLISYDYFKSVSFNRSNEVEVKYETFDASLYKAALPHLAPRVSSPKVNKIKPVVPEKKEEFKPSKKIEIVKEKLVAAKSKVAPEEPKMSVSESGGMKEMNSLVKEKKDTLWTVETKTNPLEITTEMASPIGGLAEFIKYIQKNIVYPPQAKATGQEGTVYVQFTVDVDGSVTDVHVMKGFGFGCDEEAIRVVKTSPKWKPAIQAGEPIRQVMRVPAKFRLPQ
jgi:protein TonB